MSTGPIEQDAEPTGLAADLAMLRNADIPLMSGSRQHLAAYAAVPRGSSHYGTALKCLSQAIYYEAANEPELGQRAVAQVVLNRLRHPAYPDTVCGVVYEGVHKRVCQFSFTCDGALTRAPMASKWSRAQAIAKRALAGEQVAEVGTATHYHADYVVPRWAYTLGKVNKLGRHIFYRFPGSPGTSRSFYRRWGGREALPRVDYARFENNEAESVELAAEISDYVPGTTVTRDVKDRHAKADVGGRLNTQTTWRLSIPDPTQLSSGYQSTLSRQGEDETAAKDDVAPAAAGQEGTP